MKRKTNNHTIMRQAWMKIAKQDRESIENSDELLIGKGICLAVKINLSL